VSSRVLAPAPPSTVVLTSTASPSSFSPGSVAWVMDEVKRAFPAHNCTFGILPLGTGNDLCLQLTVTRAALAADAATAVAAGVSTQAAASPVVAVAPRALLANPTQIKNAYASPDILLLDRWAVEVREVYGRRRKLLKLALFRMLVEHRGRGLLGAFAAFVSRFWGFGVRRRVAMLAPAPPHAPSTTTAATAAASSASVSSSVAQAVPQTVFVPMKPKAGELVTHTMNNYFGIGVDGAVSLGFHNLRQRAPRLFFHRWVNKLWYGIIGALAFLLGWSRDLSGCCRLLCDGEIVPIPPGTKGIIVLNVNSYAGGSTMWTPSSQSLQSGKYRPADVADGLLEVVAVSGVDHLGAIKAGLRRATPLAQGQHLQLKSTCSLPVQLDGEPWRQRACKISFARSEQVRVMMPTQQAPEADPLAFDASNEGQLSELKHILFR